MQCIEYDETFQRRLAESFPPWAEEQARKSKDLQDLKANNRRREIKREDREDEVKPPSENASGAGGPNSVDGARRTSGRLSGRPRLKYSKHGAVLDGERGVSAKDEVE